MNELSKKVFFLVFFCFIGIHLVHSQVTPALPNTAEVITCFPDTTGYEVITVGPVGRDYSDLQSAINAALPGTVMVLDAGVTFKGGFTLPDKGNSDKWIILMSSRMDLLSGEETRINPGSTTNDVDFPTQKEAMPKIVTTNLSGIPCIVTQARAHHYRLIGLEITADTNVINSYGLINLGSSSSTQNSLDDVPHHFVIDRCYIHGHDNGVIMKYGIRLDCANGAIIDSYVSGFHSIGFDAQAISGINGPGPFKILNNFLEASGENILFGGGAPAIPGLIPSDIEIRYNHFSKPWSWRVDHPDYAGKHWTIKNLFELKTGKRVLLDGNILENCWADLPIGQSGYAILLTVRTEGSASPQADVSDITITNNIIRHVGAGISLPGSDDGIGNRSARIKIANNLFYDVDGPSYGDQNIFGPNDGTFLKIGKPQDVWVDHNTILQTGPITWAYDITDGFFFTNNIVHSFVSPGGYQGIYGPGESQGNNTFDHYFPDVTDENQHFHKNVLIGGNPAFYTNFNVTSENYFPIDVDAVGFVDFEDGLMDYHGFALSPKSQFAMDATDGSDIGVDINQLDSAFQWVRGCLPIISSDHSGIDTEGKINLYPNPVYDWINISTSGALPSRYFIIDQLGRIVQSGMLDSNQMQVNVSALQPGSYVFSTYRNKSWVSEVVILLRK